jgi:hypothetical protein
MGIPSLQVYLEIEPPLPSPQDYYAAAMALFGIILFAKFVSHARATFPRGLKVWVPHWICVLFAVIGVGLCFWALGWASGDKGWLRFGVLIMMAISGLILAWEVGFHGFRGWIRQSPEPQAEADPNMTLEKALDVADQVAQAHLNPSVVERAVMKLADEVKRLRSQTKGPRDPWSDIRADVGRRWTRTSNWS